MIDWGPEYSSNLGAQTKVLAALRRAIEMVPDSAVLHVKLANLHVDRFEFAEAAAEFEAALRFDPMLEGVWPRLARCLNVLDRPREALDLLAACEDAHHERGMALRALGQAEAAEAEFRAALGADPMHRRAHAELSSILRKSGRIGELKTLCEDLYAKGVAHAQLFHEWGRALALTGETDRAMRLLFDPARVQVMDLPVPDGFADIAAFNAALAAEILTNPNIVTPYPPREEANRGSLRLHNLFSGQRPALIRKLLDGLQAAISRAHYAPAGDFDPWVKARPAAAHLRAWGLIQRGEDHEAWHLHRGGWLSGVYYVSVPTMVSAKGEGRGCIEFGPPSSLYDASPDLIPRWRHAPREGTVLLAPSHYSHRTIPTGADEYRISFAFDVVATP
jgi:hypothetical protein